MSENRLRESYLEGEIDLKLLGRALWASKLTIFIFTFAIGTLATIFAITRPNIYQSEALLAPVESEDRGGLASLAGQFGGIASLAGLNLGSGSVSNVNLAIEILKSKRFISEFIEKHDILIELMAVDGWVMGTGELSIDNDIYDVEKKKWIRDVNPPLKSKPSSQEAYKEFRKIFFVFTEEETGMVRISIEHYSPIIAQQWVNLLVKDINDEMKLRDVQEAEKSIEFLKGQIENTQVTDIKSVLYSLIEEQAKTIMFANVRDEYVFKTIDPPLVAEEKIKPKRAVMSILGFILGGLIGGIFVLYRNLRKPV
ncbi:Wzz/FepE/Etk N-terminal domain-containing protein [Pseudoalteromonas shioyasakiensis]|uniref:Wzz/FepE/Etk N-terminal domain-containing protein n=1 Tax=Pseudoalteromonas shioyasakiensis TaxID=1190813 RepID=UPI0022B21412|nr:Wzz/FepE/Etk N-terminal domain-containing protein [Pseudoalteromonas shioyasakiensis]MCZ4253677.1 Wzz/FepE/Etk N-terminal domain-containing protein [Pseudoalteromonas shioyasakiensis]